MTRLEGGGGKGGGGKGAKRRGSDKEADEEAPSLGAHPLTRYQASPT